MESGGSGSGNRDRGKALKKMERTRRFWVSSVTREVGSVWVSVQVWATGEKRRRAGQLGEVVFADVMMTMIERRRAGQLEEVLLFDDSVRVWATSKVTGRRKRKGKSDLIGRKEVKGRKVNNAVVSLNMPNAVDEQQIEELISLWPVLSSLLLSPTGRSESSPSSASPRRPLIVGALSE